jgi:hypothetical protein
MQKNSQRITMAMPSIVLALALQSYVGSSGKKVAQQEKTRFSNPL